jgi:hypothetical protein
MTWTQAERAAQKRELEAVAAEYERELASGRPTHAGAEHILAGIRENLRVNFADVRAAPPAAAPGEARARQRELAQLRRGPKPKAKAKRRRFPRGANVRLHSRSGKVTAQLPATGEDWDAALVRDRRVWRAVKEAERSLVGIKRKGSRSERYRRVTARLAELRALGVKKPGKLSDDEYETVSRRRAAITAAEAAYFDRRERSEVATGSLTRQLAAVRAAGRAVR